MKFACVFSGVGALAYGLTTAGHEPILLADCDEHAKQCLRQHFPGVELHGDVASLSALPEGTELLTGGFPCPDVSANNPMRTGMDGHRTGNFKHVIRLLKRHRVEYVLLENVTGILHRDHREPAEELHDAFQRSEASDAAAAPPHVVAVFDALEALHYHVAQRVLDLRGFGLPHMRRRVFILGALHANPRDILLAPRGKGIYSSPTAGPVCSGACAELVAGLCYHCYQHCRLRVLGDDPVANAVSRPALQCASPDSTGHFYEVDDGLRLAFERGCYRHCLVIDLGEKRCPPQLDAVQTITTTNGCRTCVVPLVGDDEQQPPARYLTPEEVELLFGLPAGWTACCMQVRRR